MCILFLYLIGNINIIPPIARVAIVTQKYNIISHKDAYYTFLHVIYIPSLLIFWRMYKN